MGARKMREGNGLRELIKTKCIGNFKRKLSDLRGNLKVYKILKNREIMLF